MCNESQKTKMSPIGKVSHGYVPVPPFTTPHRGAKSVITKLKKLVKNVMTIHGLRGRRGRNSDLRKTSQDEIVVGTERDGDDDDNMVNDNKSKLVNRKLKMAYTIEELKEIVDDNLANELREIRAQENH